MRRLKLQVNESKSAVAPPAKRKFLGFSFSNNKEPKRRISSKALPRCKEKIRDLTRRTRGISLEPMTKELAAYLRGWKNDFGFCQTRHCSRPSMSGSGDDYDAGSGNSGSTKNSGTRSYVN